MCSDKISCSAKEVDNRQREKFRDIFIETYSYSSLVDAELHAKGPEGEYSTLTTCWEQRNYKRGEYVNIRQLFLLSNDLRVIATFPAEERSNELLTSRSNNGKYRAAIRQLDPESSTVKRTFLEIWESNKIIRSIDVYSGDIHGPVYHNSTFGSLEWSRCDTKLVYIAEKNISQSEPVYKPPSTSCSSKAKDSEYIEDWGETLESKHQSVIVIVSEDSVNVLDVIPDRYSPAKPIWTPDSKGIVGVAYVNTPFRLGLVYCTNRESIIFHATLDGKFENLTKEHLAVSSPRFSPDGKYLVWLERPAGGPHHCAHRLVRCDWESREIVTVVDIVQEFQTTTGGSKFYGIYAALPKRCWTADSKKILFSTNKQFATRSYAVDVETKDMWEIRNEEGSCTVLDVYGRENSISIFSVSSLVHSTSVYAAYIPQHAEPGSDLHLDMKQITKPAVVKSSVTVDHVILTNPDAKEYGVYGAIYYAKQLNENDRVLMPLVAVIHGGPHSAFVDSFIPAVSYFSECGFAVLIVNYHGSTGFGQRSLLSLIGRIGTLDTADVYHAVKSILEKYDYLDKDNVFLFGGSHGGFITSSSIGQYEGFYRAAAMRNPVCNIPLAFYSSDIPDWAVTGAGSEYTKMVDRIDDMELLQQMMSLSPVRLIKNVKTPALFMLGKKDLRVSQMQGLTFYRMLKELNIDTKLRVYDDNHSLSSLPVEIDCIVNSVLWFKDHMKRPQDKEGDGDSGESEDKEKS